MMASPPSPPLPWEKPPRGRILVLAPHPDDEAIGCGGILALHHDQGDPIKVIFMTDGAAGDPFGYYGNLDYRELRREEARRAARILGIEALEFWGYPDGRLSEAKDLAHRLLDLLRRERPDIVYRPSTAEVHLDHFALAVSFEEAARRYEGAFADFCYEIWAMVQPTHVIDIGPIWERKVQAIEQYKSQLRYNDYIRMVSGLNAYRTLFLLTAKYAEAYQEAGRG